MCKNQISAKRRISFEQRTLCKQAEQLCRLSTHAVNPPMVGPTPGYDTVSPLPTYIHINQLAVFQVLTLLKDIFTTQLFVKYSPTA